MRTRLDEIVEEECIKGYDGTVAKRIAERTFRHGVEQHAALTDGDSGAVQPAPAEEKYQIKTVPWGSVPGGWINRRQGERRKGREMCYAAMSLRPGWWCLNKITDHGCSSQSGLDRRSGKDRRKP